MLESRLLQVKYERESKVCFVVPYMLEVDENCEMARAHHEFFSNRQQTIFEFSRLDWIQHEMEANAGKYFQMEINLPALASISCQIQSNRKSTKLAYSNVSSSSGNKNSAARSVRFMHVTSFTFSSIVLQKVQALQQELNKALEKESANFVSGAAVSGCEGN